MYGIWMQVTSVQHSGWSDVDYQEAANGIWEREEGCRFALWDSLQTLKPLLELEDSDMKRSREDPEVIDPEPSRSESAIDGRVGQKKVKLLDQMKAVKESFMASAKAEVIICFVFSRTF